MASNDSAPSLSAPNESRYRKEVLQLDNNDNENDNGNGNPQDEDSLEEQLVAEAAQLGLKIPDIQIAASLAATINAGYLDVSVSSTTGSTRARPSLSQPHAFADLVRSSIISTTSDAYPNVGTGTAAVAIAAAAAAGSSLSDHTLSDRGHSGSIPSIGSFSTGPTSISSCDIRVNPSTQSTQQQQQISNFAPSSPSSVSASSSMSRLTERKRTSFINAIGRPFRKRRTPSAVNLPPNTHITLKQNGTGGKEGGEKGAATSTVLIETKPAQGDEAEQYSEDDSQAQRSGQGQGSVLQFEVPVFDEAAMQRSMDDEQLKSLFERHKAQRARFLRLQNELLDSLKEVHLADVAQRKTANEAVEKEKREQNAGQISRMEERQLSIEMDQMKEFQKAKQNSHTRIRHMEGYVNTTSRPPSPVRSSPESGTNQQQQIQRMVTRRQKEQLAQEYLDRDSMDRLHDARIKVLRERQEQQLQETSTRLEGELEALINKHAETIAELERDHQRAEQEMLRVFDAKKNRLRRRWNIEEAIIRKRLEDQHAVPYGPLPTISFSGVDEDEDVHHDVPILKNPFATAS